MGPGGRETGPAPRDDPPFNRQAARGERARSRTIEDAVSDGPRRRTLRRDATRPATPTLTLPRQPTRPPGQCPAGRLAQVPRPLSPTGKGVTLPPSALPRTEAGRPPPPLRRRAAPVAQRRPPPVPPWRPRGCLGRGGCGGCPACCELCAPKPRVEAVGPPRGGRPHSHARTFGRLDPGLATRPGPGPSLHTHTHTDTHTHTHTHRHTP